MTVVDLGAGGDPDPRATETVDLFQPADHEFDLREEWDLPADYATGLTANHVLEHLPDPWHFFAEAARVLCPGGWLEVSVPVGYWASTDQTHRRAFTDQSLRRFGAEATEPWDYPGRKTPALICTGVKTDLEFLPPFRHLSPVLDLLAARWPRAAVRRAGAGELTARYRHERGDRDA
jgi:SAM-dependent methyltransferase